MEAHRADESAVVSHRHKHAEPGRLLLSNRKWAAGLFTTDQVLQKPKDQRDGDIRWQQAATLLIFLIKTCRVRIKMTLF